MKKSTYLLAPAFAFVFFAASCDKVETPKTTTPDPKPATPTAATPTPSGGNISGALMSINMVYNSTPAGSPIPVSLNIEVGSAVFYTAPGSSTLADAGTVSVNDINLDNNSNSYYKLAYPATTPSTMNFTSGSKWNVGGKGSVPAFSYNHSTKFPTYTGEVPSSVTKANGVTLTFTSSNVTIADSVFVVIASGDKVVTKSFAANAGTVTISSSELASLPNADNNTAVMQICPFTYSLQTISGKQYVFIKEQANVKNININ